MVKVKFTMPQNSGLRADFNTDEYHTIATKAELNAEIEARIEGDSTLQTEIARVENEIPDISGLATKAELQEVENEIPDISGLATKTELQAVESEIPDISGLATKIALQSEINTRVQNDSELNLKINNIASDIPNLATKLELQAVENEIPTKASDIGALPDTTSIPSKTSELVNDSNFATVSQIPTNNNQLINGAGYITNADLPTKTSDLTNDSGFITKLVNGLSNYYLKSETYTKQEVNSLIADIPKFTVTVVQELPLIGQPMILYLVPKDGDTPDVHNEYIWITSTSSYELIGTTAVDLDGYATENYVDTELANKADNTNTINGVPLSSTSAYFYGTSDSAADDVEKVVSIPSITELKAGQIIVVQPEYTSSVAHSTLKLNNFDAFPMRYNNADISTSTDSIVWSASCPSQFIFDGTYWVFLGHGYDANTTYTINYLIDAGRYTAGIGAYAVTRYSLLLEKPDGTWEKTTATNRNYTTSTTKTANTRGFILNQLRYYSGTSNYANGAKISTNIVYQKAATLNAAYSFNCSTAPGWAEGDYIYLVGTIGVDGLFYLDTTAWWTNTLPSTNDGKLYIRLGLALTSTDATMSFFSDRPIFYHDGTRICEYKIADNKQDKLTTGTGIDITNNVISTDFSQGLTIGNTTITESQLQQLLTLI